MKKKDNLNRATYILVGTTLLLATFAILVGLGYIEIGIAFELKF